MAPQIRLFGSCRLLDPAGQPIRLPTRKCWGLLAYLCQAPMRDVPREELAALLWPNADEAQARASLRQELAVLRRALVSAGITGIHPSKDRVRLLTPDGLIDSVEMARLLALPDRASWRAGVALYTGDFLNDLKLRAGPFEEWLWLERQNLRALVVATLHKLLDHDMASSDTDLATTTAQRILEIEPTQERAYRAMMRLLRRIGQRSEALQVFQHCADVLRRDLDADPSMETRMLADQIRTETSVSHGPEHRAPQRGQGAVAVLQLAGVGDFAVRFDPDELAQAQDRFLKRAERVVTACGGLLLAGIGDRVMAVFGHPLRQADDCDRAVQAALSLCAEPVSLSNRAVLWPRSGVAFGDMLVGAPGRGGRGHSSRPVLVGDALLRAGILAQQAAGGQVVAAQDVVKRLMGRFDLSALSAQPGPGVAMGQLVKRARAG